MFNMLEQEQKRVETILAAVIEKTGLDLTYIKRLDSYNLHFRDGKSRDVVAVCYGPNNGFFDVRSLLRKNRNKGMMSWLCNGQPNKNCTALYEWAEGDFAVADPCPTPMPDFKSNVRIADEPSGVFIRDGNTGH